MLSFIKLCYLSFNVCFLLRYRLRLMQDSFPVLWRVSNSVCTLCLKCATLQCEKLMMESPRLGSADLLAPTHD